MHAWMQNTYLWDIHEFFLSWNIQVAHLLSVFFIFIPEGLESSVWDFWMYGCLDFDTCKFWVLRNSTYTHSEQSHPLPQVTLSLFLALLKDRRFSPLLVMRMTGSSKSRFCYIYFWWGAGGGDPKSPWIPLEMGRRCYLVCISSQKLSPIVCSLWFTTRNLYRTASELWGSRLPICCTNDIFPTCIDLFAESALLGFLQLSSSLPPFPSKHG